MTMLMKTQATPRERYETALYEWTQAVADLQVALSDFMDDGELTGSGTWILTMSQTKAEVLRLARRRADAARIALDRIIDDLQMIQGSRCPN